MRVFLKELVSGFEKSSTGAQKFAYFPNDLKRNTVEVFGAMTKTLRGILDAHKLNCMIFKGKVVH